MFSQATTCYQCSQKIPRKKANTCILCLQAMCTNTTTCRQALRLTSRQKLIHVCLNCSDKELNLATHVAAPLLAPIQSLCAGLMSLQLPLSGRRVLETVTRGQRAYLRIIGSRQRSSTFNTLQEIVDFSWYLVAASAHKHQQFTSGMFVFEDPSYQIFNALAEHGYSRVLKSISKIANEKKAFGSSHFIDFIQFSRTLGPWFVPEEHLDDGTDPNMNGTEPPTHRPERNPSCTIVNGYEQIGIDLRKRHLSGASKTVTKESCENIGVYLGRRHLLSGKLPKKNPDDTRHFTFVKLETHGTSRVSEALGHSISFIKTRNDVGRSSRTTSKTATPARTTPSVSTTSLSGTEEQEDDTTNALINENTTEIEKRKEHAPKRAIELFQHIMALVHGNAFNAFNGLKTNGGSKRKGGSKALYHSPLSLSEITTKRPKVLGLSFMSSTVQQISHNLGHTTLHNPLRQAVEEWHTMVALHDWDHMDVRFGQEVIMDTHELTTFANCIDPGSHTSNRLLRSLRALSRRANLDRTPRTPQSCFDYLFAIIVGLVVVSTLLSHVYGCALVVRRIMQWSPVWTLAITEVIGCGTTVWTFVLVAWIVLADGRW